MERFAIKIYERWCERSCNILGWNDQGEVAKNHFRRVARIVVAARL